MRKDARASVFRRFLLDTFGKDTLSEGAGVLDVAGGKGEISFQLLNLNGIKATVVDPRPLQLPQFRRRLACGMYHRNAILATAEHVSEPLDSSAPPKVPGHLPLCLDEALLEFAGFAELGGMSCRSCEGEVPGCRSKTEHMPSTQLQAGHNVMRCAPLHSDEDDEDVGFLRSAWERARQLRLTHAELHEDGTADDDESERSSKANKPSCACDGGCCSEGGGGSAADVDTEAAPPLPGRVLELLREASIIVGMHPDQATEAIVDLALRSAKPFAVVPCCVFSADSPNRRLEDGRTVVNYTQFVRYLLEKGRKAGRVVEAQTLPFDGKNVVLFAKPL